MCSVGASRTYLVLRTRLGVRIPGRFTECLPSTTERSRDIPSRLRAAMPVGTPTRATGCSHLGALGYVVAAQETLTQMAEQGLAFDEVVVPSGSGKHHAGMLFGLRAPRLASPRHRDLRSAGGGGPAPTHSHALQRNRRAAGLGPVVDDDDIILNDAFFSPGYGQFNEAAVHAMKTAAECEGLILDPSLHRQDDGGLPRPGPGPDPDGRRGSLAVVHHTRRHASGLRLCDSLDGSARLAAPKDGNRIVQRGPVRQSRGTVAG